jgi:probable HAF family extracellular repeat protein
VYLGEKPRSPAAAPTLGGTNSSVFCGFALAINASGQVVGESLVRGNTAAHAFRTAANSAINPATDDLGTLGATRASFASGINASGQVVGYAYPTGDTAFHAFRRVANSAINPATDDLDTLGATKASFASGINTPARWSAMPSPVVAPCWLFSTAAP